MISSASPTELFVAPRAGARIETGFTQGLWSSARVAPRAGARIETHLASSNPQHSTYKHLITKDLRLTG